MHDVQTIRVALEEHLPAALQLLERMVAINSFTGNAAGVNQLSRLTADSFAPLGFEAEWVPSTNPGLGHHLCLQRRGSGPHAIALISHLDTVFPPEEEARHQFTWRPEGTRIYGPGTDDVKGGTVLIWLVLTVLRTHAPVLFAETTWQLFLNSSEETLSDDFGALCRERFAPGTRAALVFEGEHLDQNRRRLVVARKGRATWRVTVTGRSAHAGNRLHEGANAVVQLGQTLQHIAQLTRPEVELTFNPAWIRGGSSLNRVPHEAVAEGEFRAYAPTVFAEAKTALLALSGPGQVHSVSDGHRCRVHVEFTSESRPWPRNAETDRLFALWQSTGRELGMVIEPETRGGLSDANQIWDAVPTLDGLGPYGDNAHCSERSPDGSKLPEFIEVTSIVPKALLNILAIARLLGQ